MRRILATVAVSAALLTGGLGLTTATASAAPVAKCDGVTAVKVGTKGDYVRQPYHKTTGSRNCTLAEGTSGSGVVALQTALKSCNYATNLTIDGDFGQNTKKAVSYAQYKRGITQDGIYGPLSRKAFTWPVYYAAGNPSGKCVHTS